MRNLSVAAQNLSRKIYILLRREGKGGQWNGMGGQNSLIFSLASAPQQCFYNCLIFVIFHCEREVGYDSNMARSTTRQVRRPAGLLCGNTPTNLTPVTESAPLHTAMATTLNIIKHHTR